jgi:hypothetical protein
LSNIISVEVWIVNGLLPGRAASSKRTSCCAWKCAKCAKYANSGGVGSGGLLAVLRGDV